MIVFKIHDKILSMYLKYYFKYMYFKILPITGADIPDSAREFLCCQYHILDINFIELRQRRCVQLQRRCQS